MAQFELTRSDYFSASWYLQRNFRRRLYVLALAMIFFACLLLCSRGVPLWLAAFFGSLGAMIAIGIRLLTSRGRILRVYDDHLSSSSELTVTLSEEGFEIKIGICSSVVGWSEL